MDKVLEGDAMVSHKGIDYTFSTAEKDDQSRSILIPDQRGFKAGQFVVPLHPYRWLTQVKYPLAYLKPSIYGKPSSYPNSLNPLTLRLTNSHPL